LADEDFKARFGAVYEGLNTEERNLKGYVFCFMLRRMLFSLLVVLLPNWTFLQIQYLMYF